MVNPARLFSTDAPCSRSARVSLEPVTTAKKRKRSGKVHIAVDALGQLLAEHVTPANEQGRTQVGELVRQVRLPEILAGLHFVVFFVLMLIHFATLNKSA